MGLDLDVGAEVGRDRRFELAGDFVGVGKAHPAVDFEVERDALAPADVLDAEVVDKQAPAAGDEQNALEQGLVVERHRIGGERHLDIRLAGSESPPRRPP